MAVYTKQTIAKAFESVPASDEKTNLSAAFDTLLTRIDEAQTAGAFSTAVEAQLTDEAIDLAEQVAANMTDHS